MTLKNPIVRRVRRFFMMLRPRIDRELRDETLRGLSTDARRLFLSADPADQAHSLRLYERLIRAGHAEPELLTAALFHDIGKRHARLTVINRTAFDLLSTFCPQALPPLAEKAPRPIREPLIILLGHGPMGAADARAAGLSERVACLIALCGDHPGEKAAPESIDAETRRMADLLVRFDSEE